MKFPSILCVPALVFTLSAAEPVYSDPSQPKAEPVKALMITGGGYHDYKKQQHIISKGVSARVNVKWTIAFENPKSGLPSIYSNPDWAKGYDVIVHNECHARFKDPEVINKIVKAHLDNAVGVVMVHCAMHTFRDTSTKEWDKLVGVQSRRHGPKFPIKVVNAKPEHPIMKAFPESWTSPQGELYITTPLKGTIPLGIGGKPGNPKVKKQVCVWASTYGKTKTFGITLGHHNVTVEQKTYLDLLSRGILWTCDKLGDDGKPKKGYEALAK